MRCFIDALTRGGVYCTGLKDNYVIMIHIIIFILMMMIIIMIIITIVIIY